MQAICTYCSHFCHLHPQSLFLSTYLLRYSFLTFSVSSSSACLFDVNIHSFLLSSLLACKQLQYFFSTLTTVLAINQSCGYSLIPSFIDDLEVSSFTPFPLPIRPVFQSFNLQLYFVPCTHTYTFLDDRQPPIIDWKAAPPFLLLSFRGHAG